MMFQFQDIEAKLGFEIPKEIKLFYDLFDHQNYNLILCDKEIMLSYNNILNNQEIKMDFNLFPILENENGDFAYYVLDGIFKGMICIIYNDEPDLSPKFVNLWTLLDSIKLAMKINKSTGEDFLDFRDLKFDFPIFNKSEDAENYASIKIELLDQFIRETDIDKKITIAYSFLGFANKSDYFIIKKHLLDSDDPFIQERTIETIKLNYDEQMLEDIFSILNPNNVNPILATAVMIREDKKLFKSKWNERFENLFPEIAKTYIK